MVGAPEPLLLDRRLLGMALAVTCSPLDSSTCVHQGVARVAVGHGFEREV